MKRWHDVRPNYAALCQACHAARQSLTDEALNNPTDPITRETAGVIPTAEDDKEAEVTG